MRTRLKTPRAEWREASPRLVVKVPVIEVQPRIREKVRKNARHLSRDEHEACVLAWVEGSRTANRINEVYPSLSLDKCHRAIDVGEPALGLPPVGQEGERRVRDLTMARERARAEAVDEARKNERVKEAKRAEDAYDQRAEEARMVRMTRQSSMALGVTLGRLLKGAMYVAETIEIDMMALGKHGKSALSIRERMGFIRTIGQIAQRASEVSRNAVMMERLLVGDPTTIIGHQVAPMSDEEARRWFALVQTTAERTKTRTAAVIDADYEEHPPALGGDGSSHRVDDPEGSE
jgi:hypothetical protein